MVVATATPKIKGPLNLATAVNASAIRGRMAREEIIVATTLLESWTPLRKSKASAKMIRMISDMGHRRSG